MKESESAGEAIDRNDKVKPNMSKFMKKANNFAQVKKSSMKDGKGFGQSGYVYRRSPK